MIQACYELKIAKQTPKGIQLYVCLLFLFKVNSDLNVTNKLCKSYVDTSLNFKTSLLTPLHVQNITFQAPLNCFRKVLQTFHGIFFFQKELSVSSPVLVNPTASKKSSFLSKNHLIPI